MASEHAAQVSQKMGTAIYAQAQAANANAQGGEGETAAGPESDDEVVEAEIVDDEPADREGGAA